MNWADNKARLSHDVLSNQIETELMALESEPSRDCPRLIQFVSRETEFKRLLQEAPDALSTRFIIDWPIFDVWEPDFRSYMRQIANALFHTTSGVPEKAKEVDRILDNCIVAVKKFINIQNEQKSVAQVKELRSLIEQLRKGISSLPYPPSYHG